ncbi:carotenoid biosynthesis protein [Limosilactobacillus kribbianus]|uniref:carotenoid biosynthesis protein n=1 Tax=Limosilactobacillus kribbianus TaxID=2982695 RepID=UPI002263DD28|nr:carotenoid biosynthesis protein [Limosilactobacillus kribbianus]
MTVMFGALIMLALMGWLFTKLIGLKPTLEFIGAGVVIAWCLEDFGVHTGLIFGHYYFTHLMGPKIDAIPVAIPCMWVFSMMMIWVIVNLFMDGTPLPSNHSNLRIICGAIIEALLLTTFDLNGDPFSVQNHMWVWTNGGTYFGVPIHNYVGWFTVALITFLVHGYIYRHDNTEAPITLETRGQQRLSILPILLYGLMNLPYIFINVEGVLGLVTVYFAGIPFLVALWLWGKWYFAQQH